MALLAKLIKEHLVLTLYCGHTSHTGLFATVLDLISQWDLRLEQLVGTAIDAVFRGKCRLTLKASLMLVDCIRKTQSLVRWVWTSTGNMLFLDAVPGGKDSDILDMYARDILNALELRLYQFSEAADYLFDRFPLRKVAWQISGFKSWRKEPPKYY